MIIFVTLALALTASVRSLQVRVSKQAAFEPANGQTALALNEKFKTLTLNSPCTAPEDACVDNKFVQCVRGEFVMLGCAPGTVCAALPLVNSPGASITCTTEADLAARIAATGPQAEQPLALRSAPRAAPLPTDGDDPQTSLTLDPDVISKGFENDGQGTPTTGQVASLTSTNNFINFCKTVNLPLTNGTQAIGGSCNPAPMGAIPAKTQMPSSKFVFPPNGGIVSANTLFTIKMAIKNLETGNFVNADQNYFSAPQQLNSQGIIRGHSHVAIEKLDSLAQTTPTDPTVFAFFRGLNNVAQDGILSADVPGGLPAGFYKLSSVNSAANHQPVLVPIAQRGSVDDTVYFTVV